LILLNLLSLADLGNLNPNWGAEKTLFWLYTSGKYLRNDTFEMMINHGNTLDFGKHPIFEQTRMPSNDDVYIYIHIRIYITNTDIDGYIYIYI